MLKSFLQSYLEVPIKNDPLPTLKEIAWELSHQPWFREYINLELQRLVAKNINEYKREFAVNASSAAKESISFVNKEEFLDSFVERILKKQMS